MSSAPTTLEVRDATGRGLRVEFVRRKDRYGHIIWLLDGETSVPAWESLEGTDADDWPASPPLQQLSIETLADGRRVALLVGMAGTSHWSLSVEANADGTGFVFDVACRVKQAPAWLGSRYKRNAGATIGLVQFNGATEVSADLASIERTPSSNDIFPRTVRWRYGVAYGNSHKTNAWPFDQPPNCATLTMRQIMNGSEPILLVSHDADDHGWQFIGTSDALQADARVVCLEEIVRIDSSVLEVADLPPGWQAIRDHVGAKWIRRQRPPDIDDGESI